MARQCIKYLGQCGFLITSGQVSLAIDPVLNDLTDDQGISLRAYPAVMEPKELNAQYVLCTHDHIDHMALETLVNLAKSHGEVCFVVPKGCVILMEEAGISEARILGVSDGETISLADNLQITGFSAAHPIHQLDDKGMDRNLVYGICLNGRMYVHLGDTYRTDRLVKSLETLGDIDVFFPPINGRDEEREAKGIIGNLSSEEAAELAVKLNAELTIPTHFDMVLGNTEDPQNFVASLLQKKATAKYWIPDFERDYIIE